MGCLLSAIFVVDELEQLEYVPWKEAAASALRFADELIVVHGCKKPLDGQRSILDHFRLEHNASIQVVSFPWPEKFDWRQIARSCAYGQLHASGDWCFRVLVDEVFPDEFDMIREVLKGLPPHINVVAVWRYYLLGSRYAYPYRLKPLFFRSKSGMGYGTINPEQGEEAMPLLFDDPIDTQRWFNGEEVVAVNSSTVMQASRAAERLLAGETPHGYRDLTGAGEHRLELGFLNVDVNFLPNEFIVRQKMKSLDGYLHLPSEYPRPPLRTPDAILSAVSEKVKRMLASGRLVKVKVPDSLLEFADRHDKVVNVVRDLCELEYGLPWNRVSKRRTLQKQLCGWLRYSCGLKTIGVR